MTQRDDARRLGPSANVTVVTTAILPLRPQRPLDISVHPPVSSWLARMARSNTVALGGLAVSVRTFAR